MGNTNKGKKNWVTILLLGIAVVIIATMITCFGIIWITQ
jgi:NhaP-type Na+/H+ or K+/H+ antiporter